MQTIDFSGRKTYNVNTNGEISISGKLNLISVIINTKGGASNTCVIYKGGPTVGADPNQKLATLDTATSLGQFKYECPMLDGIYMVVGGGTAPDLTIVYETTP